MTASASTVAPASSSAADFTIRPENLGDPGFLKEHGVRMAYLQGAMVGGIGSSAMVIRMAKAGLLGFWGSGGLPIEAVEKALQEISSALKPGQVWGMNLLHNLYHPEVEEKSIDLYFKYGVTHVEAAAFMTITSALIRFRVKGLKRLPDGTILRPHKVIAKLSRPEVAVQYLSPPPEKVVLRLLAEGKITQEEADLSKFIPMAEDITVEADSGGHTDKGIAYALMPAFMRFRDEAMAKHKYPVRIRIGAAGGLGTPQSIAAAFVLGADYVLTGSINQCTVEAGTSDIAKDLLAGASMADTEMAPAGDMFELGVQVQVLRKGTFFPQRAQKLYELWKRHNSLDEIEPKERENLEKKVFKKTFNEIYDSVKEFFGRVDPAQVVKAEANPKHKMALVFRWYLGLSSRWGIKGEAEHKVDFQIHTGPAQGAFNEWVKGTRLENWRNRHVDEIADLLMQGAAKILTGRLMAFTGRPVAGYDFNLTPR